MNNPKTLDQNSNGLDCSTDLIDEFDRLMEVRVEREIAEYRHTLALRKWNRDWWKNRLLLPLFFTFFYGVLNFFVAALFAIAIEEANGTRHVHRWHVDFGTCWLIGSIPTAVVMFCMCMDFPLDDAKPTPPKGP